MKAVQINSFGNLSTGSVMRELDREYTSQGYETWMFWGRGPKTESSKAVNFNNRANLYLDALMTRFDGAAGFHSTGPTKRLLERLDEIDPDVVHLHNLHGYYVNIEMLFEWLALHRCQVKWTLHDCWAFTGHCAYFTYAKCAQWKTHCANEIACPQLDTYPKTYSKISCSKNFARKKQLFTLLPETRMTLVTPSDWLESLVKESFLAKYPVEVRHNKIDKSIFKPTNSDFRERYGIGEKYMVLGVASSWSERKGLTEFVRLSRDLGDSCAIVLVGLNKKQINKLPTEIIALNRTDSAQELAKIYSAADVFFNPTLEDNYPTVNLEAEACGTRVVAYDTGGCRETISREDSILVSGYDDALAVFSTNLNRNKQK
jgi:glycosyltransferase involved in cell wall biosynthesis